MTTKSEKNKILESLSFVSVTIGKISCAELDQLIYRPIDASISIILRKISALDRGYDCWLAHNPTSYA
jgi:hypothetical protein